MPFQPAGERARWRIIYEDVLLDASVGTVVTYDALGKALNLDPAADRHTIQLAVRKAAATLERQEGRVLDAIAGTGYEVVPLPKHLELANRHQLKARRSMARGRRKVDNPAIDLSTLDPTTRELFELAALKFQQQDEAIRRIESSQRRQARRISAAETALSLNDQQLAELQARVEKLEGGEVSSE